MVNRMKIMISMVMLLLLAACVVKPPVQEMAEARSAVQMAQELGGHSDASRHYLQNAKKALKRASEAIEEKKYERARSKALEAKRQAQQAVHMTQKEQ